MKVGDIVHIEFWDHSDIVDNECQMPIKFEVFGRLLRETKIHYLIAKWMYPGAPIEDQDHNTEYYSIIKGAVIKARSLK